MFLEEQRTTTKRGSVTTSTGRVSCEPAVIVGLEMGRVMKEILVIPDHTHLSVVYRAAAVVEAILASSPAAWSRTSNLRVVEWTGKNCVILRWSGRGEFLVPDGWS